MMKIKKENIGKNFSVFTNENHTFTTDAVLLADFAEIKSKEKVCDFGTGCGIIPVIFARDNLTNEKIFCVEISKEACELFSKTLKENGIEDKIKIINNDLKNVKEFFSHASFDVVTMNPPYFEIGTGKQNENEEVIVARHEVKCDIFSAAESAAFALKHGGRFVVCHRAERLSDVIEAMRKNKIEPKRLRFVMSDENESPYLILVEGRKGGKNNLKILSPLILNKNGNPSEEYLRIYSAFYEKEEESIG